MLFSRWYKTKIAKWKGVWVKCFFMRAISAWQRFMWGLSCTLANLKEQTNERDFKCRMHLYICVFQYDICDFGEDEVKQKTRKITRVRLFFRCMLFRVYPAPSIFISKLASHWNIKNIFLKQHSKIKIYFLMHGKSDGTVCSSYMHRREGQSSHKWNIYIKYSFYRLNVCNRAATWFWKNGPKQTYEFSFLSKLSCKTSNNQLTILSFYSGCCF